MVAPTGWGWQREAEMGETEKVVLESMRDWLARSGGEIRKSSSRPWMALTPSGGATMDGQAETSWSGLAALKYEASQVERVDGNGSPWRL